MVTRAQAEYEWFQGLNGQEPAGPDVGEAFRAGWNAAMADPVMHWAHSQWLMRRKLVALIPPTEAHEGPRYAGYYCVDGPDV